MSTKAPPEGRCPSCGDRAVIKYWHNGIAVYPCQKHWDMHCHNMVPYSLKTVADRYRGSEEK